MSKLESLPGVSILVLDLALSSLRIAEECETIEVARKYIAETTMAILEVLQHAKDAAVEVEGK